MRLKIDRPLRSTILSCFFLAVFAATAFSWQQNVHYRMWIDVDAANHTYQGHQQLIYRNNSPDTLHQIYYHLFYNAFKPGSVMDRRDHSIGSGWKGIRSLRTNEEGDVAVQTLTQNGAALNWEVDETILRAELATPLLPGDSAVLEMKWRTKIPRIRRRGGWMSNEGVEFSMSQWYPKLAEYDRHGWHPDEYVDREFYGVFGTFDVHITLPARYIVGGTGTVTNPEEVQCGYEFADRDTLITSPANGSGEKTWKFHAENVHDFAWVADPEYVHQVVMWKRTPIHLLYKRTFLTDRTFAGWRYAGTWTKEILSYFSNRFGEYAWPQFTVAQAGDGGMEYPMLIMITGYRGLSSLYRVIAHEAGHQWYYGMMGNNETQEAWLDEGLAQFLTDEADRGLNGERLENPLSGLKRMVYVWDRSRWRDIESAYRLALNGYSEPLNTYHDRFRDGTTASLVYYKGEAVLRQLQYMFGDSLLDAAMRQYYADWQFRHPDTRDFERSMEVASGMRLDWFFNQWIGSNKTCDYALDDVTSTRTADGNWTTTLALSNRDEIIMPVDVQLTYEDGTTAIANIPVEDWKKPGMDFHLPRWVWVDREYSTTFSTPQRVTRAEIDPSLTLMDLDHTNNIATTGGFPGSIFPPSHVAFYRRWDMERPMDRYSIRLRPTLWYSEADGPQIGFLADGGYTFDRYQSTLGLSYNTRSNRVDYRAEYETPVDFLGRLGRLSLSGTNNDGIQLWNVQLEKELRPFYSRTSTTHKVRLFAEHSRLLGDNYPNVVAGWDSGDFNTIGLGYSLKRWPWWQDRLRLDLQFEASFASRNAFAQWQLGAQWETELLGLESTLALFAGTSAGTPPVQRMYNAAGASSHSMHANPVHRLFMNIKPEFAARNHLILPTEGYLTSLTEAGNNGVLARHMLNAKLQVTELNPMRLLKFWPFTHISVSPYAAGGWVFPNAVSFEGFEKTYAAEAGLVGSVDVLNLLFSQTIQDALDSPAPVQLSMITPLWARSPLLPEQDFRYRWGIGVSVRPQ